MLRIKDRDILRHIEKYGFITINQCATLFYDNIRTSYTGARKRLQRLTEYDMASLNDGNDEKLLKYWINPSSNQKVYSLDGRRVSQHSIYIMDFYSKFKIYNADILYFVKEKKYMKETDYTIVPDAFCRYVPKGYSKSKLIVLEVDYTHKTDLNKYIEWYESGEIQQKYGGVDIFPKILIADENPQIKKIPKNIKEYGKLDIQFIDFKYNNFVEKVLS
jgi:hypothetical protein